jgi:hypothetical protein
MSDNNSWEAGAGIGDQHPEGGTVSGVGADPTHHIALTDGVVDVGFVLTDQSGEFDERTLRRFPRTEIGQPYVTEKQDSWGGGFGQATFEDNRTKYWRGKGVDTTKDVLVLGPAFHYGQGAQSLAEQVMNYDTMTWYALAGAISTPASPFTPTEAWTQTKYLKFYLYPARYVGTLPTLRVRLYTDEGNDEPTTLIETFTFLASEFDDITGGDWVRVDISDTYSYSAGTKYWVVWDDLGDGSGWYKLAFDNSSLSSVKKTGGTWGSWYPVQFRIESNPRDFNARFFTYKGQLYSVLDYDDTTHSKLYMNGWRGACDTGGTLSQLKDSTNTDWGDYITGDEVAQIVAGPASAEMEDRRGVRSGVDGTLTLDDAWYIAHSTDDEYAITNSDRWFVKSITSSNLYGHITDLAIADGVVYLARGEGRPITLFREYNLAGSWQTESNFSGARAQFIQMVSDVISGDTLWFGKNVGSQGEYRPSVWQSEPADFEVGGLDFLSAGQNSGDSTKTQYWEAVGSDVSITGNAYYAKIDVTIGKLQSVSVGSSGGTGYGDGDVIKVLQAGSTKTARVSVTTSGGVVTGAVVVGGYEGEDYDDTGTDVPTEKVTGSGSGCVLDIGGVSSVSSLIAYMDLFDADDVATTYDVRNMTTARTTMTYKTNNNAPSTLDQGDIKLLLDDGVGSSTPFATADIIGLSAGRRKPLKAALVTLSLENEEGAQAMTSIGIAVASGLTKSFTLTLLGEWAFSRSPSPVVVSDVDGDNITGLETFGDPQTLWVFTEAGFGQMKNNKFLPVPQREVKTARHANNGTGHGVSDVYLLFTWRGRLQRYFRQNMEDLGPDFPAGMGDIAGDVTDIVSYPGRIYVAIDAGTNGKSMILCYKGGGWHEVWTGFTGERIRNLYVQPIEGKSDKLWASVGGNLMWFPIALDSAELPDNTDYRYRPVGYVDSSWVYTGSRDLDKLFRSILLTIDDATNTNYRWDVFFKIDDPDVSWTRVTGSEEAKSASLREYFFAGPQGNIPRGSRIRVRLYMETLAPASTPTIRSTQMRIYRIPEVKYSYTWLTKLSSISINLRGDEEKVVGTYQTVQQGLLKLDEWASTLQPLQVTSTIAGLANDPLTGVPKQVVLSPIPTQLLLLVPDEPIQEQVIQVQVSDV